MSGSSSHNEETCGRTYRAEKKEINHGTLLRDNSASFQEMKAGNERFCAGKPRHGDLMAEAKATAKGQYPAIVFSCVDSGVPAELILDFGIGDIFSSRVAGNVVDDDVMGRMGFVCKAAGAKVVLVMALRLRRYQACD